MGRGARVQEVPRVSPPLKRIDEDRTQDDGELVARLFSLRQGIGLTDDAGSGPGFKVTPVQQHAAQSDPPLAIARCVNPSDWSGEDAAIVLFESTEQFVGALARYAADGGGRMQHAQHFERVGRRALAAPARSDA